MPDSFNNGSNWNTKGNFTGISCYRLMAVLSTYISKIDTWQIIIHRERNLIINVYTFVDQIDFLKLFLYIIHGIDLECYVNLLSPVVYLTENKFSEWLWHETRSSRMKSLNSSFVQGVKDGTLHPTYFGRYLIQDAVFCLEFSKALEVAATKSGGRLKIFLENEVKVYKSFGEGILNDWYVQNASAVKVGPECQGFIDHLLNVSLNEDPIYIVVASIPCERLWPWLGLHQFGPYKDWVMTYFSPAYAGYHKFEAIANAAYVKGKLTKDKALQIYTKSMEGEAAFFNSIPVSVVI
ncbi:unnamed protein product [Mytilus coruscus]|uniref:Thiaminase-2/PQQC domain-containing protein n=1 Tax=Mytilus coruscus TaxID=42192 RepID=A0A6J8CSV9_MYTCO|nr:unnamed protein product [Mytilus coruscus]